MQPIREYIFDLLMKCQVCPITGFRSSLCAIKSCTRFRHPFLLQRKLCPFSQKSKTNSIENIFKALD